MAKYIFGIALILSILIFSALSMPISEEERALQDEEQLEYLEKWREKQQKKMSP